MGKKYIMILVKQPYRSVIFIILSYILIYIIIMTSESLLTAWMQNLNNPEVEHEINFNNNMKLKWTVLVTVSQGMQEIFNNWLYFYRKLGLSMQVLVVVEDKQTFERYKNEPDLQVLIGGNDTGKSEALSYNTTAYKDLVSRRAGYLIQQIEKGKNVIYTDVDTVWLADPRLYFIGNFEVWTSLDLQVQYCTGFIAFKATEQTKEFLHKWDAVLKERSQLNQKIYNDLITSSISSVKHTPLPVHQFPSGILYFHWIWSEKRKYAVVVHNNFIIGGKSKIYRFKKFGLWYKPNWYHAVKWASVKTFLTL